jgi:PAS domain S-box-containing protein
MPLPELPLAAWQAAFDLLPDPMFLCASDSRVLYANPAAKKILADTAPNRIGYESGQDHRGSNLVRIPNSTTLYEIVFQPLASPGTEGLILGSIRPLQPEKLVGEEGLNLLPWLLDSLPDQIFIKNRNSQFVYNNLADARSMGVDDPNDLIGRSDHDFYPPELAEMYLGDDRLVIQTGQTIHSREEPTIDRDGARRWLSVTKVPLRNQAGQVIGLLGIGRDITERRALEDQITRSKNEWQATIDAVADMVLLTDPNGVVIRCNRAVTRKLNASYHEVLGQTIHKLFFGVVQSPDPFKNPYEGEATFPRLDGIYNGKVYPVRLTDGTNGIVYAIRDVTTQKQMENTLTLAQKMADLGTLAAGVAHELNSPLQVITGISESLLEQAGQGPVNPERLAHKLEAVNRNAWRCANIVRSLLTYARPSTGQLQPENLNEMIGDTLLLIEHQLHSWNNIQVNAEYAPDLPPLVCSRNQIAQILINLLVNARDAMPGGGQIVVRTGYRPRSNRLVLEVQDEGSGIPPELQGKIFDPFFTTKPVGHGTGLGLSIVQGILRAHGGEIQLRSTPGAGTTFTLLFPLKPVTGELSSQYPSLLQGRFTEAASIPKPLSRT